MTYYIALEENVGANGTAASIGPMLLFVDTP